MLQDDGSLLYRIVQRGVYIRITPPAGHLRREYDRFCRNTGIDGSGEYVPVCLGDALGVNEPALYLLVNTGRFQGLKRLYTVGGALRVRYGYTLHRTPLQ